MLTAMYAVFAGAECKVGPGEPEAPLWWPLANGAWGAGPLPVHTMCPAAYSAGIAWKRRLQGILPSLSIIPRP